MTSDDRDDPGDLNLGLPDVPSAPAAPPKILPLESQVCCLDLARQLRDAGFPQSTEYCWTQVEVKVGEYWDGDITEWRWVVMDAEYCADDEDRVPAYTVAELGVLLPRGCETHRFPFHLVPSGERVERWGCSAYLEIAEATEADARARYLAKLVEAGRVGPNAWRG